MVLSTLYPRLCSFFSSAWTRFRAFLSILSLSHCSKKSKIAARGGRLDSGSFCVLWNSLNATGSESVVQWALISAPTDFARGLSFASRMASYSCMACLRLPLAQAETMRPSGVS